MAAIWFGAVFCLNACRTDMRPPIIKDGERYGVVKGAFRHKWWNYYERGLSFMDGGFWRQAEADFRAALSKWAQDEYRARTYGMHFIDYFPHRELGVALFRQDRFEAAIRELETSLSMVKTAKAEFFLDRSREQWLRQHRLDHAPPEIFIETPTDGALTADTFITIRGKATDDAYVKAVSVNSRPVRIDLSASEIRFEMVVPLHSGENEVEVAATDLTGKRRRAVRRIWCDRSGPVLTLDHKVLPDGDGSTLYLDGYATDDTGIKRISVNGRTLLDAVQGEAAFTRSIPLEPDRKQAVVVAVDKVGNETRAVLNASVSRNDIGQGLAAPHWLASRDGLPSASGAFSGLLAARVAYPEGRDRPDFRRLGDYYALIIGIDAYQEWRPLNTAVKDALAVRKVLIERYGFPSGNIIFRRNEEATQQQIIDDLMGILPDLKEDDNFLLYFAGHGELRKDANEGFWIPVDGKIDSMLTWVSHSSIKNLMASPEVKAKNIVVIADSCYGGFLTRAGDPYIARSAIDHQKKLLDLAAKPSRQVIASGSLQPVADWGIEGHSVFAYYFLKALKQNHAPLVDIKSLIYANVWPHVTDITDQRPTMGRFDSPMDRDGEFILALAHKPTEIPPLALLSSEHRDHSAKTDRYFSKPQKAGKTKPAPAPTADRTPPRLAISHWQARQTVQLDKALIDGRATDDVGVTALEINGVDILKRAGKTVYFSQVFDLAEKDNVFLVTCRDASGKEARKTIALHREIPEIHQTDSRMSMTVLPFRGKIESAMDFETMLLKHLFDGRRFNIREGVPSFDGTRSRALNSAAVAKSMAVDAVVSGDLVVNDSGVEIKARVIDADTADILTMEDAFSESASREAVRKLCQGLSLKIEDALPLVEGMVVLAEADEIYVDIGAKDRLKKSMELIVYKQGEPIVHPITGKVMKTAATKTMAQAKVVSVEDRLSVARVADRTPGGVIEPTFRVITR